MKRGDKAKSSQREILRAVVFAHFDVGDGRGPLWSRSRRRVPGIDAKQLAGTGGVRGEFGEVGPTRGAFPPFLVGIPQASLPLHFRPVDYLPPSLTACETSQRAAMASIEGCRSLRSPCCQAVPTPSQPGAPMKAPSWPLPSPVLHGRLPGKPSTLLVKRDGGERFMAPRAYHCGCPTTSIARPATWVCRCLSGARLSGSMLQWRGVGEMLSDVKASMDIFGHFGGGRTDKASRTEGTEGCPQGMGLLMTRTWGVARTLWRPKRRLRAGPS